MSEIPLIMLESLIKELQQVKHITKGIPVSIEVRNEAGDYDLLNMGELTLVASPIGKLTIRIGSTLCEQ